MDKQTENRQQEANQQEQPSINKGEHKVGRADQEDRYDISHVDRQEGAMDNGTLGGNFSETDRENEKSAGADKNN